MIVLPWQPSITSQVVICKLIRTSSISANIVILQWSAINYLFLINMWWSKSNSHLLESQINFTELNIVIIIVQIWSSLSGLKVFTSVWLLFPAFHFQWLDYWHFEITNICSGEIEFSTPHSNVVSCLFSKKLKWTVSVHYPTLLFLLDFSIFGELRNGKWKFIIITNWAHTSIATRLILSSCKMLSYILKFCHFILD